MAVAPEVRDLGFACLVSTFKAHLEMKALTPT